MLRVFGLSYHHNDVELDGEELSVYEHNGLGTTLGDTWIGFAEYRATDRLSYGWQGRFVTAVDSPRTGVGTSINPVTAYTTSMPSSQR